MTDAEFNLLEPYCRNNMRKLKAIVRAVLKRFNEPVSPADMDDFYSIANLTLWRASFRYRPTFSVSFNTFLTICISKDVINEIRSRHRIKRFVNHIATSLDAPTSEEDNRSLLDTVAADFDTFEIVMMEQGYKAFSEKVQVYLSRLSPQETKILFLLMNDYTPMEIREILNLNHKTYNIELQYMRSYDNVKILL